MPHRDEEITLLRKEVEMLMNERQRLLEVVGIAASLVASFDTQRLPVGAVETADLLATVINRLSEETLQDALNSVHAESEDEENQGAVRA